jgi:hypothetical protein
VNFDDFLDGDNIYVPASSSMSSSSRTTQNHHDHLTAAAAAATVISKVCAAYTEGPKTVTTGHDDEERLVLREDPGQYARRLDMVKRIGLFLADAAAAKVYGRVFGVDDDLGSYC